MSELYVLFKVGDAEYALAAAQVLQLETFGGLTVVPGTALHVTGIVQVRGLIVPVVDLRLRFGLPAVEPTLDTRIVIAELRGRTVGLRVDSGREVLRIAPEHFQTTPSLVNNESHGFVSRIARVGSRVLMLLDLPKVLGEEELYDDPSGTLPGNSVGFRALPG